MATLPEINVWSVDSSNIILSWKSQFKSSYKSFNLYGCSTYNGVYTLVQSYIPNVASSMAPGSVLVTVSRSALGIASSQPYFFKITSINFSNSESSISASPFVAVDAADDVFRNRVSDNNNPVYKFFTVSSTGTPTFIDVQRQLGRLANYLKVITTGNITVQINSPQNDSITVTSTAPLEILKSTLTIESLYITGSATVTVLVTGQ